MTGIRKRVTIGFLSIVTLLFVSGMISLFELGQLSNDAEMLMSKNRRNMELAKDMFEAMYLQGNAMAHIAVLGERDGYDTICLNGLVRLETSLTAAYDNSKSNGYLDSLTLSVAELRMLTETFLANVRDENAGTEEENALTAAAARNWFSTRYETSMAKISEQISGYIAFTYKGLAPRAEQLSRNAYRAVTPVLISLLVMIAIVLMLFYFVMIYCVNPVLGINRGLADYLSFKLPFAVKQECRDELQELKENIETLINISKQNKA